MHAARCCPALPTSLPSLMRLFCIATQLPESRRCHPVLHTDYLGPCTVVLLAIMFLSVDCPSLFVLPTRTTYSHGRLREYALTSRLLQWSTTHLHGQLPSYAAYLVFYCNNGRPQIQLVDLPSPIPHLSLRRSTTIVP